MAKSFNSTIRRRVPSTVSTCLFLVVVASSAFTQQLPTSLPDKSTGYLTDGAHVLSRHHADLFAKRCYKINQDHLAQIAIVTIPSPREETIESISAPRAQKGASSVDDGLVLFLDKDGNIFPASPTAKADTIFFSHSSRRKSKIFLSPTFQTT
jgi:uncharacterized membrane protein YgcG